jgi:hypothetical protein
MATLWRFCSVVPTETQPTDTVQEAVRNRSRPRPIPCLAYEGRLPRCESISPSSPSAHWSGASACPPPSPAHTAAIAAKAATSKGATRARRVGEPFSGADGAAPPAHCSNAALHASLKFSFCRSRQAVMAHVGDLARTQPIDVGRAGLALRGRTWLRESGTDREQRDGQTERQGNPAPEKRKPGQTGTHGSIPAIFRAPRRRRREGAQIRKIFLCKCDFSHTFRHREPSTVGVETESNQ